MKPATEKSSNDKYDQMKQNQKMWHEETKET